MPRRKSGRTKMKYPMSFKKMCNLVGVTPLQRIKLVKLIKKGDELIN